MVLMRGEQYHHNNPSVLTDQLYLSAARAISSRVLKDLGITCVINATLEMPTFAYQKQDCMQIAVEDRVCAKLYVYFDVVADKIASVHKDGGKMIIYCRAGMSRSATLCIAYFMKYHQMSLDDAFQYVRERRPIIHPNAGFMRQLREYEAKIKTRRGAKRKHEDEVIQNATEETLDTEPFDTELGLIKPRPKPRICKPKPVDLDALECAEVYMVTAVQTCMDSTAAEVVAVVVPPVRIPPGTKKRPKARPYSMPHGPSSTAISPCNSSTGLTEALGVCEKRCESPLWEATTDLQAGSSSGLKKRPFSKISEPARIAVSCMTIPWGLCSSFGRGAKANFNCQVALPSVFADVHLAVAQKSQEVTLECAAICGPPPQAMILVKAKPVIAKMCSHLPTATSPVILECHGVYKAANVNLPTNQRSHEQVPKRLQGLQRLGTSRASIKLPGLKISPLPEKHHKRPLAHITSDFFAVALSRTQPLIIEEAPDDLPWFRPPDYALARTIVRVPDFSVAFSTKVGDVVYERAIKDPHITFKVAWILTVPRRTVLLESGYVAVSSPQPLVAVALLPPEKATMPSKEYPYYSPVRKVSRALEMMRATESPTVQASWFFALKPRASTKAVRLVPKKTVEPKKVTKSIYEEPEIHWAAERCQFDPTSCLVVAKAMEDLQKPCKASKAVQKGLSDSKWHHGAYSVLDQSSDVFHCSTIFGKQQFPESYKTWSIMRMCIYPLYSTVQTYDNEILVMNNLYCEPRPFLAYAKCYKHEPQTQQDKANVMTNEEYLSVATCSLENFNDNLVELVEIPDVVGNINEIKPLLAKQRDPVKMSIWLEVFKRSVMRARPIRPFVTVTEMLPTASCRQVCLLCDSSNFSKLPPTIPKARALVTMVDSTIHKESRQQESFPVQVTDCVFFDAVHQFNPIAAKLLFIHQREKAIESTEYIRNYSMAVWSEPLEEFTTQNLVVPVVTTHNYDWAQATVAASLESNNSVASVETFQSLGCLAEYAATDGTSVITWLKRKPFQVVSHLHFVADKAQDLQLTGYADLPRYEFVQDIEDQADCCIQQALATEDYHAKVQVTGPVDIFWFFQLDTPKTKRRSENLSSLGAAAACPVELANNEAGKYQLFLPDPDMMDRLGQVPPEEAFCQAEEPLPVIPIVPAVEATIAEEKLDLTDFVQGSVKDRSRSKGDRRVVIADPPVSGSQSPPRSPRNKSISRLMCYQRPRSRSRSTKRKQEAVLNAHRDKKTMDDLQASVKFASDLLDRRRTAGSSSYASSYNRGRPTTRPQVSPTPPSSHRDSFESSTSSSSRSSTGSESTATLWGLFDMAQSWIMSHRSRRDRSEEKSRALMRRTKQQ